MQQRYDAYLISTILVIEQSFNNQIIKFVMSSAARAELAGLFITAKNMIPLFQALIEMAWPQPKSTIKIDNSTAVGVTNRTVVANKIKYMDMHAPMVADMPRVPGSIQILLGVRVQKRSRLTHQTSP